MLATPENQVSRGRGQSDMWSHWCGSSALLLDHDCLNWSCWAHPAVMGNLPGVLYVNSSLEISSSEVTSG